MIFHEIRTSIAKKPYIFVIFGGGGGGPDPCPLSGSAHAKYAMMRTPNLQVCNGEGCITVLHLNPSFKIMEVQFVFWRGGGGGILDAYSNIPLSICAVRLMGLSFSSPLPNSQLNARDNGLSWGS